MVGLILDMIFIHYTYLYVHCTRCNHIIQLNSLSVSINMHAVHWYLTYNPCLLGMGTTFCCMGSC